MTHDIDNDQPKYHKNRKSDKTTKRQRTGLVSGAAEPGRDGRRRRRRLAEFLRAILAVVRQRIVHLTVRALCCLLLCERVVGKMMGGGVDRRTGGARVKCVVTLMITTISPSLANALRIKQFRTNCATMP